MTINNNNKQTGNNRKQTTLKTTTNTRKTDQLYWHGEEMSSLKETNKVPTNRKQTISIINNKAQTNTFHIPGTGGRR
jgi:hypothetical protein